MENSILTSTKKVLGVSAEDTSFDLDIITHINSTFSILNQLGIPANLSGIEDDTSLWTDLNAPPEQLQMIRAYMYLKVRMLFDPPTTSFVIDAISKQIQEHEYRLSYYREGLMS